MTFKTLGFSNETLILWVFLLLPYSPFAETLFRLVILEVSLLHKQQYNMKAHTQIIQEFLFHQNVNDHQHPLKKTQKGENKILRQKLQSKAEALLIITKELIAKEC